MKLLTAHLPQRPIDADGFRKQRLVPDGRILFHFALHHCEDLLVDLGHLRMLSFKG
ncbi:MAG: hypothetical protein ACREL7_16250 [Longimicrobiales bacterium]